MGFLRVVEIFPPFFPAQTPRSVGFLLEKGVKRFLEEASVIRKFADIILVADVKNTRFLKFSTVEAAVLVKERLGVDAAPVIVLRDFNRQKFLSAVLTGISMDLKSMMIAWGDQYPPNAKASNVRDFSSLAAALRQASFIRKKAGSSAIFLAPVDVGKLAHPEGVALAKGRLRGGADYLLAQPPTTDAAATFDRHLELLEAAKLKSHVLLNVFPFRDSKDVKQCERYFGWRLSDSLHLAARRGTSALFDAERGVIERLREERLPGVYLNTRGSTKVAERLLA
jgi:5,10-methylenetetrahydrofolate reductase